MLTNAVGIAERRGSLSKTPTTVKDWPSSRTILPIGSNAGRASPRRRSRARPLRLVLDLEVGEVAAPATVIKLVSANLAEVPTAAAAWSPGRHRRRDPLAPWAAEVSGLQVDSRHQGRRRDPFRVVVGQVRPLQELQEVAATRERLEAGLLEGHGVGAELIDLRAERAREPAMSAVIATMDITPITDTQDGQRRAQLVGTQGVERNAEDFLRGGRLAWP